MPDDLASLSTTPPTGVKHPAGYARRMLMVAACTAMLALVGVLRAGQPAASSSSAQGIVHAAGTTVHTTSGGSLSISTAGGATAGTPASASHTVSGGS